MSVLSSGSTFAGHRIEAIVGRGGMGIVYRATDLALDRPAALKVIASELAQDQSFRERFKRESRIAASIRHPNVITIHSAGEQEGVLYIAMDYVAGTDLRWLIEASGTLPEDRATSIISQIASALDAAHRRGLVHRDVKPANILIENQDGEDHCYLTDFGLARDVSSDSRLTRTGAFVGTPAYVAPEQVRCEKLDRRTDVYALGCVLYEVLTGEVPYPSAGPEAHVTKPPPSLREAAPHLHVELDAVIRRAMAKDREHRYQSAGGLARAALAAAQGRPAATADQEIEARAVEWGGTPVNARPRTQQTQPIRVRRRLGDRMGPVGIALASVFVLGLVAAGIAITGIFGQNDHASRNAREAPTNTGVAVASKSARSVEQAIERHWAAIAKGRLDAAYDDLSPRLKADPKTGSRSVWIANQRTDRLRSESVRAVAHDVRKGRARADIALRTRALKSGCREWSGGYGLVWRGGRWLIDEANIVPRPC